MTLHTTRWSPDTCGCVIDYEWDDAAPENTRTHSLAGMGACCAAHSALPPPVAFNTVMEENQRKNRALGLIKQRVPDLVPGSLAWSFDAGRRLRVTLVGVPLPAPQRVAIQAALDAELGPGRATLL